MTRLPRPLAALHRVFKQEAAMRCIKAVARPILLMGGIGLALSACIMVPAPGNAPRYGYAPPPSYAPPPQAYAAPPPQTFSAPSPGQACREFQGDAVIDGSTQKFYGTACRQPDGRWHIVN